VGGIPPSIRGGSAFRGSGPRLRVRGRARRRPPASVRLGLGFCFRGEIQTLQQEKKSRPKSNEARSLTGGIPGLVVLRDGADGRRQQARPEHKTRARWPALSDSFPPPSTPPYDPAGGELQLPPATLAWSGLVCWSLPPSRSKRPPLTARVVSANRTRTAQTRTRYWAEWPGRYRRMDRHRPGWPPDRGQTNKGAHIAAHAGRVFCPVPLPPPPCLALPAPARPQWPKSPAAPRNSFSRKLCKQSGRSAYEDGMDHPYWSLASSPF
jgi:hypothetical protein